VGGAAARYIDPSDPAAAAEHILSHVPELPALSRLGLDSAARWSTARMIQEYEEQYLRAVQESAVLAAVGT
jgi:phosphopentomutase